MPSNTEIDEYNGPTTAIVSTHNVGNFNFGTTDASTLTPASFPITAGNPSFEKHFQYHVVAISNINIVNNLQVFSTSAFDTGITVRVNLVTTQANYSDLAKVTVYAQGLTTTSALATFVAVTVDPGTANLGIAAILTGTMTATAAISDFLVMQMQTLTTANPGPITQLTWTLQRDEQAVIPPLALGGLGLTPLWPMALIGFGVYMGVLMYRRRKEIKYWVKDVLGRFKWSKR